MRNLWCLLVFTYFISSCSGRIAKHEFEGYQWRFGSPVILKFQSDKIETKDLFFEVRSVYGIPQESISLDFVIDKPNGDKVEFSKDIDFNEENLNCSGDLCDQKILLVNNLNLEKGSYSITISSNNIDSKIYGLMEFGIIKE